MMLLRAVALVLCSLVAVQGSDPGCAVDGKIFQVGDQHDKPGHCNLNVCKGNDQWTVASCGLIGIPQGWNIVPEDPSKGYPECCSKSVPGLNIVPDVLENIPGQGYLEVTYDSNLRVEYGKELTPTQVKTQPAVHWNPSDHTAWYLICMTDPDAPSRQNPKNREFLHWLVGNIPRDNIADGDILTEYVGSGPPKGTGHHRYVLLVYKQPGKLTFDEPRVTKTSAEHRSKFSIRKFAEKYNLGDPIAVTVYQAQYDDYVPQVHKQLGFK